MKKVLLFPLLWAVLVASAHAEVGLGQTSKPADATSAEGLMAIPREKNWYVGGSLGIDFLRGWNPNALDGNYRSYYKDTNFITLFSGDRKTPSALDKLGIELNIYAGYRLSHSFDIEWGLFSTSLMNWKYRMVYSDSVGTKHEMKQKIYSNGIYVSTAYRPFSSRWGNGFYLKLGGHYSELKSMSTFDGNPVDVNALGGAGSIPSNGTFQGYGSLFGVGYDVRLGKTWAVRLESSRYNRLGGTRFGKEAFNLGFNAQF